MDQYQPKLSQGIFFAGPHCGQSEIIQPSMYISPLTAKLFDWNFHPLEVVSR